MITDRQLEKLWDEAWNRVMPIKPTRPYKWTKQQNTMQNASTKLVTINVHIEKQKVTETLFSLTHLKLNC